VSVFSACYVYTHEKVIEVEGLEKYTFKIENDSKEHKVTIEDRINRHTMQFDKPHKDKNSEFIIRGENGVKIIIGKRDVFHDINK
jgi:hypothetical protein